MSPATSPFVQNLRQLWPSFRRRLYNPRLWRAGGTLMLANLIVTILGVVRTPLMTWMLPKVDIGMLGVVAAWLPIVQLASLPGVDSAAYHYVAKGDYWAYELSVRQRLKWSILSALLFAFGALYWLAHGQVVLGWLFIVSAVTFPTTIGLTGAAGMLGALERFSSLFWFRIAESLTDFAGFIPLLLALIWLEPGLTFFTANQVATTIMLVAVTLSLSRQGRQMVNEHSTEEELAMLRYGKSLTWISSLGVIHGRVDLFLISMFTPLTTTADYSIATLVAEQLRRVWNIFLSIRYPPLVRMEFAQKRRRFVLEGGLVLLGLSLVGALLSLAAHLFIPIILPPTYATSLFFIDLLILAVVVGIPGWVVETYFRSEQDDRSQWVLRGFGMLTSLAISPILLYYLGAVGAVLGRIISNILLSAFGIILFSRHHPVSPSLRS